MAIAHVQTSGAAASASTTVTVGPITTTPGNLLHANLSYFGTFSSLTDNKGNTWVAANAELVDAGGGKLAQFYAPNCLGGSGHTFTLTLTAADYPTLSITEVSGIDVTPLDDTSQVISPPSGEATTNTADSITTTVADTIIIAGAGTGQVTGTLTVDGTYAERYNQPTTASLEGLVTATRILTATETDDFTVTSVEAVRMIMMLASYKVGVPAEITRFTYLGPGGYPLGRFAAPAVSTLSASVTLRITTDGALTTETRLAGAANLVVTTAGSLTNAIAAAAQANLVVTTAGSLTTAVAMAGAASLVITTSGTMAGSPAAFAAQANLVVTDTGSLTTAIQTAAAATLRITTAGALTTDLRFAGTATAVITATASLTTTPSTLEATATLRITTTGNLSTVALFAGTAALVVTTAANLTTPVQVAVGSPQFIDVIITVTPVPVPTPIGAGHARVLWATWGRPGLTVIGRIPSPTP